MRKFSFIKDGSLLRNLGIWIWLFLDLGEGRFLNKSNCSTSKVLSILYPVKRSLLTQFLKTSMFPWLQLKILIRLCKKTKSSSLTSSFHLMIPRSLEHQIKILLMILWIIGEGHLSFFKVNRTHCSTEWTIKTSLKVNCLIMHFTQ